MLLLHKTLFLTQSPSRGLRGCLRGMTYHPNGTVCSIITPMFYYWLKHTENYKIMR